MQTVERLKSRHASMDRNDQYVIGALMVAAGGLLLLLAVRIFPRFAAWVFPRSWKEAFFVWR
jgi:hypothetical protein